MPSPLRSVFNEVAELYDRARPACPVEIVEAIIARSLIQDGGSIVEVGCGTGQITLPFAERGYAITAIELGDALVAVAARKLLPYPRARVVHSAFEEWGAPPGSFDMLLSSQAFHWIDPEFGCARAAELVRPGGAIALLWHVDISHDTPFWKASQPLYSRHFPKVETPAGVGPGVRQYRAELAKAEHFSDVEEVRHRWSITYSGEGYLDLLHTFSNHMTLPEPNHTQFFAEMAELIDEFGGVVERHHDTVLLVARRR